MMGRLLAREHPVDADIVVPVPDSGVAAAWVMPRNPACRIAGADPQSLCGPDVY